MSHFTLISEDFYRYQAVEMAAVNVPPRTFQLTGKFEARLVGLTYWGPGALRSEPLLCPARNLSAQSRR